MNVSRRGFFGFLAVAPVAAVFPSVELGETISVEISQASILSKYDAIVAKAFRHRIENGWVKAQEIGRHIRAHEAHQS